MPGRRQLRHPVRIASLACPTFASVVRIPLTTWIFAAANDASRLNPALISRFGGKKSILRFREYAPSEFVAICECLRGPRYGVFGTYSHRRPLTQA